MPSPILEMKNIEKHYGAIIALAGVSFDIKPGEVHCLLGDNGAGKSTFIKIMSGVHHQSKGDIYLEGAPIRFANTSEAIVRGIATVYQDLALIPLMSIARNFVMGREPMKKLGPIKMFDLAHARAIAMEQMHLAGIDVRDPDQAVGTLSGGERQTVAIARAVYYGAKILILDEPTSALGVHQTSLVLSTIEQVRASGVSIVFITHNTHHALQVGDRFTVLARGRTLASMNKSEANFRDLQELMSGGKGVIQTGQPKKKKR